jgi:hypothetical protein
MAKYLPNIMMTQRQCSYFQLIFVIGEIDLSLHIISLQMVKFGKVLKNLMDKL